MTKKLQQIKQKIGDIQVGLLRVRDENTPMTLHVKTSPNADGCLDCVVTDGGIADLLLNKNVNLIQKYKDDYLYITGKVSQEVNKKTKIISINILKACWFVRRTKGNVTWLKEKYIYDKAAPEQLELAS